MKRTVDAREGAAPGGRRALALALLWTASLAALLPLGLRQESLPLGYLGAWLLGLGMVGLSWREQRARLAEQTRQERAATLEARTLRSMIEGMDEGVVVADARDVVTEINGWFLSRVGLRREDVIGKKLWDLHPATPGRERARAVVEEYRAGARQGTYVVNRDLLGMHLSLRVQPVFAEGRYQGSILNAIDVTDLEKARRDAEAATRAKGTFLANMSHEIRTPLNAVLGLTGLLLDTALDEQQRDCLETLRDAGESLLLLVNDVLEFSSIDSGRMELEQAPFDLRQVMESAADLSASAARAKPLELTCFADPACPRRLLGDPERLRQVLVNLASNALKFTERGSVDVFAERVAGAGDGFVRFTVADTGMGIAADRRATLFERFAQADGSTTRRFGGAGLGLAISRGLVKLMGGEIGAESRPGAGSSFWFTVPCRAPREESSAARQPEDIAPLNGARVLIADDSPVNRQRLAALLTAWGCVPEAVADGAAALARLAEPLPGNAPFRALLLDDEMPGMSGAQVLAAARGDPRLARLPVLFMSTRRETGETRDPDQIAGAEHVAKPIREGQLRAALARALARQEAGGAPACRAALPAPAEQGRTGAAARRIRVLLAEDNSVNQKVATAMLAKCGCRTDVAANGREAVVAVQSIPYDLVLMDVQMPEMDGFAATAEIRALPGGAGRTPIVAMTAHALRGYREKCMAAGMDDFLAKPVRIEELRRTVVRWAAGGTRAPARGTREIALLAAAPGASAGMD
ncbi:MAG: response regulator [Planctomycetes bacterium]|nr:response regulator [Planctomycetota bacterium]